MFPAKVLLNQLPFAIWVGGTLATTIHREDDQTQVAREIPLAIDSRSKAALPDYPKLCSCDTLVSSSLATWHHMPSHVAT